MDGVQGELPLVGDVSLEGMQGIQESDGEGGTRSEAGHGRQIGIMLDLHPPFDPHVLQAFPDGGMDDLIYRLRQLGLGVPDPVVIGEEGGQVPAIDVTVLVDGG